MECRKIRLPDIGASRSWRGGYDRSVLSVGRGRLGACTDARQCDGACGGSGEKCGCYQVGREIDRCGCFGLGRRNASGL